MGWKEIIENIRNPQGNCEGCPFEKIESLDFCCYEECDEIADWLEEFMKKERK